MSLVPQRVGSPAANAGRAGRRFVALLLLFVLPLVGCYRTIPLSGGPQPGVRIVATLTREGTERMFEHIGGDVVRVEAEAGIIHPDRWDLRLIRTWDRAGQEYPWARETVSFPRNYLERVEQRELDRRRTWLTAGAIAVVAVAVGRAFLKGVFGDDDKGPEPPPPPQ